MNALKVTTSMHLWLQLIHSYFTKALISNFLQTLTDFVKKDKYILISTFFLVLFVPALGEFRRSNHCKKLSQCNFYSFLPNLILLVHCLDFYRRVYYIDHNTNAMVATNSNLHFFTLFLSSCSLFCGHFNCIQYT